MENDEKKYENVIKALKGLQEVKASANFEADLKRRINSEKFSKEEKKSFWQNIFVPVKLIPSLGLVAVAFVIFFMIESRTEEMDNPFLIEPRVREDVFAITDFDDVEKKQEDLSKQKSIMKDEPALEKRNDENQLKTSDEKMVTERKKSDDEEGFSDQSIVMKEQDTTIGAYSAIVESTEINVTQSPGPNVSAETPSEIVTGQAITKEELNFRQIQLNEEQQKVVNELKMQVQSSDKTGKTQK